MVHTSLQTPMFPCTAQEWLVFAAAHQDTTSPTSSRQQGKALTATMPTSSRIAMQQAYAEFLAARQNEILRSAHSILRNREDAMDVLQEVALKLYQLWGRLDEDRNIDGWLYRVTVNECYRWLRTHRQSTESLEDVQAEHLQSQPSQEAHIRSLQFQRFLAGALEVLSEQERLAYVFKDLEQRPGREIAALMGCQGTTARGYYFSARKKLATFIQEQAPDWLALLGKGGAA